MNSAIMIIFIEVMQKSSKKAEDELLKFITV